MSGWLVGRAVRKDFSLPHINEMARWLRSLGVDPTYIVLRAAVVQRGDRYELHVSEYVLDEHGRKHLDLAANEPVTRPVVVPVEKDSWPAWLTGLGLPHAAGEHGPELVDLPIVAAA